MNKAPLLTPAHQRMVSLNQSQALSPNSISKDKLHLYQSDIAREKSKIAKYLNIKERNGQNLADRERRIEQRRMKQESKQKDLEKSRRIENRAKAAKLAEQKEEWNEKRKKVRMHYKELENKAIEDYRSTVKLSKERMK